MADLEISTVPVEGTIDLAADYFWIDDISDPGSGLNRVLGSTVRSAIFATDVAIVDGGTGASNASAARTNLGVAYGKQTIYIPASGMLPALTNGATANQLETATNKINYAVLDFSGSTAQYAHFNIATPKSWNAGSLSYIVYWESTAADTDGVAWTLQAVVIIDGDDVDATWGTATTVVDNAMSTPTARYYSAESTALTVGNSPASGEHVQFRFGRNPAHGSDTMAEDARLVGIKLLYTVDAGNDN